MKSNKLNTNRFVIRQSLIGKNTVITFTTKKGKKISYNHDVVYNTNKDVNMYHMIGTTFSLDEYR